MQCTHISLQAPLKALHQGSFSSVEVIFWFICFCKGWQLVESSFKQEETALWWWCVRWPEQIRKWHPLLLLCTTLWSAFQTPGGVRMIKKLVWVQHRAQGDLRQTPSACWWVFYHGQTRLVFCGLAEISSASETLRRHTCRFTVGGILMSKLTSISAGMTL